MFIYAFVTFTDYKIIIIIFVDLKDRSNFFINTNVYLKTFRHIVILIPKLERSYTKRNHLYKNKIGNKIILLTNLFLCWFI